MAYAVVQTGNSSNAGSTSQGTVMGNTTTGNTIIATFSLLTNTVTSVTDSQSNTYTKRRELTSNNSTISIWVAENITGGTTPTVTGNFSNISTVNILVREYSGLAAASFDQSAGAGGVAGTASSGNTSTTTQANELVFGAVHSSSNTPTAGAGFGNFATNITQGSPRLGIEDKRVTSTGVQAATFGGTNSIWACAVITLKEASAPSSTPTRMLMGMGT